MSLAQRTKKNKVKKLQKSLEKKGRPQTLKKALFSVDSSDDSDDSFQQSIMEDMEGINMEECLQLSTIASMDLGGGEPIQCSFIPFRSPISLQTVTKPKAQTRGPITFVVGEVLRDTGTDRGESGSELSFSTDSEDEDPSDMSDEGLGSIVLSEHDIDSIPTVISDFVHNGSLNSLELPPMWKRQRVAVAKLGAQFLLRCVVLGSGELRGMRLEKRTFTPVTQVSSSGVSARGRSYHAPSEKKARVTDKKHRARDGKKDQKKRAVVAPTAAEAIAALQKQASVPSIVVAQSQSSNVGWRLLRGMGWDGGGLGSQGQGIAEPVLASLNPGRRGLGAPT